jgi:hypothetical protein
MKAYTTLVIIFLSVINLTFPISQTNNVEWDYTNYLYSIEIIEYDEYNTAGQSGIIKVVVGANTEVVLHVEFKGSFDWGHWIFHSRTILLESGLTETETAVDIPYKALIEPTSEFYYYVYVTLLGDEWNPEAWGLAESVYISAPEEVYHVEFVVYMNHLCWLVDSSDLSGGVKQSLFSKLEAAGSKIDMAYISGNLNKLHGAVGSLNSFINELNEDGGASMYPDSTIWLRQAELIIERIQLVLS